MVDFFILEEEASMECYVAIFPTFSSQFAFRLKEPKIFIFQSPPSPRDEMFCALIISGTWLARVCRIGITSLGRSCFPGIVINQKQLYVLILLLSLDGALYVLQLKIFNSKHIS